MERHAEGARPGTRQDPELTEDAMHDTARRILGNAATVKAAAAGIDTSRTETVPADALTETQDVR